MTAVFSSSSNFGLKKEIEIPEYRLQEQIKRLKSKGMWLIYKKELTENFHNDIKKDIKLIFNKLYSEPIIVFADKDKIQQVITNLIINSIKYGTNKGTTEVSLESITSDKLIVRITDNGEGIQKEHLSRLFERFYRVDQSGSRKQGGSGLGLSIVKHIIDAHNENVYVESKFGIGSEFSFTLTKDLN